MQQLFNILLVEDNAGDAFLIREHLKTAKKHKYHLIHTEYLSQAIALIAKESIDIILLDLSLPDSQGLETLETIEKSALGIPIVILSGIDDEKLAIQAVRQGAQDYLFKGSATGGTLIHALRYAIERKQIEEQLRTKTAQLEASNKELKTFSYMVSHDLRNPLTVIKGMSTLLKKKYETRITDEREKMYVEHICQASDRMEQIIQDLLILSQVKEQKLDIKPVNLNQQGEKIIELLQRKEPERHVNYITSPNIVAIGDPHLLNHVMENLLHNAWKYTAKQKNSTIEFGVINPHPPEVNQNILKLNFEEVDNLNQRNRIRYAHSKLIYFVRDNGIGFNSSIAQQLFTPFHRLDNARNFEGTGIGLTIVQSIVRRHNGKVWAEAEENIGATFYFTLGF